MVQPYRAELSAANHNARYYWNWGQLAYFVIFNEMVGL